MTRHSTFSAFVRSLVTDGLRRLLAINILVFVGAHAAILLGCPDRTVTALLSLPAAPAEAGRHVYGALFYMFTQFGIVHLLYNMLWLWCFGTICTAAGISSRTIVKTYLLGGLAGAAMFVVLGALGAAHGRLIGASAAVMAVTAFTAVLCGRRRIQLVLFGSLEVRWLAVIVIALTLAGAGLDNVGQTGPHLAGVIAGVLYAVVVRRRTSAQAAAPHHVKGVHTPDRRPLTTAEMKEFDALLARVSRNGYASLSPVERGRLFSLSQRINN